MPNYSSWYFRKLLWAYCNSVYRASLRLLIRYVCVVVFEEVGSILVMKSLSESKTSTPKVLKRFSSNRMFIAASTKSMGLTAYIDQRISGLFLIIISQVNPSYLFHSPLLWFHHVSSSKWNITFYPYFSLPFHPDGSLSILVCIKARVKHFTFIIWYFSINKQRNCKNEASR